MQFVALQAKVEKHKNLPAEFQIFQNKLNNVHKNKTWLMHSKLSLLVGYILDPIKNHVKEVREDIMGPRKEKFISGFRKLNDEGIMVAAKMGSCAV